MKKSLIKYPYLTEDVEIYERDNGHKIVLAHKEGELVNVSTWVKTGSINEDDKNNGISHFLEHLMFKGTHKHKAGYFDKTLEAKGAIVNAATWKDYTFYYVTLPKGPQDRDLYLAIELHADMMLDPVLPEEEIGAPFDLNNPKVTDKRERHVVIEEIRMRKDQNWTKVYNACNFNMYKKHPYKRDVIGTPEIISRVTRDEIMNYYKTFYSPENMTTIIVGDFDKEKVLTKVEKEFDFKGRPNAPKRINEIDAPADSTVVVENKAKTNTSYLMVGFLGPKANQLKENIELDIISIILGESTSSRLYQNLIEKQPEQIFNMANAEHYQFKDGNNFFIQANFKPEKRELALELIKKEIESLITNRITGEELEKAKKKTKSRFAFAAETVSEIGETIGYYMTVCEDLKLIENYLKDVEEITIEDLENTVKKYLNLDNAVISILEPET
ncbi:MAG TPA: insulinase family protein [Candidatus Stercorousia faecigallinarum]|nr:insulinase family protein [Candidatus Stercorousia faecigallinarum]